MDSRIFITVSLLMFIPCVLLIKFGLKQKEKFIKTVSLIEGILSVVSLIFLFFDYLISFSILFIMYLILAIIYARKLKYGFITCDLMVVSVSLMAMYYFSQTNDTKESLMACIAGIGRYLYHYLVMLINIMLKRKN